MSLDHLTPQQRIDNLAKAQVAMAAARIEKAAYKEANTHVIEGYTITPAIGASKTGEFVGWELHPPEIKGKAHNPPWYLQTKDEVVAAIPRHKLKYM